MILDILVDGSMATLLQLKQALLHTKECRANLHVPTLCTPDRLTTDGESTFDTRGQVKN